MVDYSLESLCVLFSQHADQADKQLEGMLSSFKEQYPEDELPKHLTDDFNIARAIGVMAEEIIKLKNK